MASPWRTRSTMHKNPTSSSSDFDQIWARPQHGVHLTRYGFAFEDGEADGAAFWWTVSGIRGSPTKMEERMEGQTGSFAAVMYEGREYVLLFLFESDIYMVKSLQEQCM
ncbi:hypothetical protein A0H81_02788 [Grifola frondosa]|uniref:Uncharacterized protein n=1 Tax=Grifola frondosa TaxID=5627 RepID=A0A1C7MLB8_GRIFR|nr:hypothetical protein A0H81_02788 [Grifola frondosa]